MADLYGIYNSLPCKYTDQPLILYLLQRHCKMMKQENQYFSSRKQLECVKCLLTLSLLDWPKLPPLLFYSVQCQMILLVKGEASR